MSDKEERKIQWQPMIELIIVLATVVGTTVPLYIHTDSKMQEHRKETTEILNGIREDMRDFHIKLSQQDFEFKNRLCAIEERSRK